MAGAATDAGTLTIALVLWHSRMKQKVLLNRFSSATPFYEEEPRGHSDPLREPGRREIHFLLETSETPWL